MESAKMIIRSFFLQIFDAEHFIGIGDESPCTGLYGYGKTHGRCPFD